MEYYCIDCKKPVSDKRWKRCTACHCGRLNKARIGIPMLEETKEKLRMANTGKVRSAEAVEKMRQTKLANPTRYWLGKHRSEDTKRKVSIGNKGKVAWNKGIPWSDEVKQKISEAGNGQRRSPATEFKKGMIPVHKGVFGEGIYSAHNWIKAQNLGRDCCEICNGTSYLEWSNKDHKYQKNLDDWQYVCRRCHMIYDKEHNGRHIGTRKQKKVVNK